MDIESAAEVALLSICGQPPLSHMHDVASYISEVCPFTENFPP